MAVLDELRNMIFANRSEEAAWWEANGDSVADSLEKALNEGYVGPCTVAITGDSTTTKIRLGSRDVARARASCRTWPTPPNLPQDDYSRDASERRSSSECREFLKGPSVFPYPKILTWGIRLRRCSYIGSPLKPSW